MKTLKEADVKGKRVFVRCDFNVPLGDNGKILDDFRIKETLSTIQYLIKHYAKIILASHLGDPEGKVVESLRLDGVAKKLSELLGLFVKKLNDCIGEDAEKEVYTLESGEILLLENLRFHKEETENNHNFAKELSKLAEIYVNDAFSVCHRNHASVVAIAKELPAFAGLLLEKEISSLGKVLKNPEKPVVVIIGGKKVETKTKVINEMSKIADCIIVSGLIKKEIIDKNIKLDYPGKILGPEDKLDALDIDQKAIDLFKKKISGAKTILWNGPFGKTEDKLYKKGTLEIAKAIVDSAAFSVAGGGETIEFLNQENLISKFNHVSTGGGAMLAYLAGEKLTGLEVLDHQR